jgi:putative RecB family exonuclease
MPNPPETFAVETAAGLAVPEYLSASSIGTWQQCPLKYKYSRIDRIEDPPTEATLLGNFVHDVLEQLLGAPSENRTLADARVIMRTLWENQYETKVAHVLYDIPEKLHAFRWRAWWCVENYFSMEEPHAATFDGLEDYVTGKIGEAPLRGYIDRWVDTEDGIIVGDYKTGKTPKPQWRGDKFQQLLIYALLLGDIHDRPVKSLELLYLKDGVRLTQEVKQSELTKTVDQVSTVYAEIKTACASGHFEAKKHRLCDWCSYKSFCPAWS